MKKTLYEIVSPGRYVPSGKNFVDYNIESAMNDKKLEPFIKNLSSTEREEFKKNLESKLLYQYDKQGKDYYENNSTISKVSRYMGLGANVIGGIAIAGGIAALIATGGAALPAIAGISAGLGTAAVGAGLNTVSDAVDSNRLGEALGEKDEKPEGVLGYIKKGASGAWEYVKAPFRGMYKGAKAIAEGSVWRSLSLLGPSVAGYLGLGPYAQIGSSAAGGYMDFYRGRKKFDDILEKNLRNRAIDDLIKESEMKLKGEINVLPIDKSGQNEIYIEPVSKMNYVEPRVAA